MRGDVLKAELLVAVLEEVQQALCNHVERVTAQSDVPPDRRREQRDEFKQEDYDADEVRVFHEEHLVLQLEICLCAALEIVSQERTHHAEDVQRVGKLLKQLCARDDVLLAPCEESRKINRECWSLILMLHRWPRKKTSSVASSSPRNVCTWFSSFMRHTAWSMYHGALPTTNSFRDIVSFFSVSVECRPWKGRGPRRRRAPQRQTAGRRA